MVRNARVRISRDNSLLGAIKSCRVMWRAMLLIMQVIMIVIIIVKERLHAMMTFVSIDCRKNLRSGVNYEKNKCTHISLQIYRYCINYNKVILKKLFENILKIDRFARRTN